MLRCWVPQGSLARAHATPLPKPPARSEATGDQLTALKLLGRLRCCCQLEALLDTLLQFAPPLFALPPLGSALASWPGGPAAGAAAAAPKKAAAKSGAKGGKKKGVKFADEDNASGGAGGSGSWEAGGGAASQRSQHTASGTGSGGAATQSGAAAATQAVSVAASGGMGRMAAEQDKQRSLLLPALRVLGVGAAAAQEQPCYSMLPSAAYILADLHGWAELGQEAVPAARIPLLPRSYVALRRL